MLKQFIHNCEEQEIATTYVDELVYDVPQAMNAIVEQLENQGHELKKFKKRYEGYR